MRSHPTIAFALGVAALAATLASPPAAAEETRIAVRVLSRDAKFIGSSMGGMRVTLADADTGEVLASGTIAGSTGDTGNLVVEPRQRGATLSTPGSAAFTASLDLAAPIRLKVTAVGPLGQRQAAGEVSVTQWVVPGKHLDGGDGVLLELPGFAVDVLAPANHARLGSTPQEVEVRANLTMA